MRTWADWAGECVRIRQCHNQAERDAEQAARLGLVETAETHRILAAYFLARWQELASERR